MPTAETIGLAGLQGWREKVADGVADPVAQRTPLSEQQVRAVIGAAFFALALMYVVKTANMAAREARQG